jgi:hypothetical protein
MICAARRWLLCAATLRQLPETRGVSVSNEIKSEMDGDARVVWDSPNSEVLSGSIGLMLGPGPCGRSLGLAVRRGVHTPRAFLRSALNHQA